LAGGQHSTAGRRLPLTWLGAIPFFAYVGVFLLLPTGIVVFQAFFSASGQPTMANINALTTSVVLQAFAKSISLSLITAVLGAALGAVLAYMIASGPADGTARRLWLAATGVLAQFGGVTLAFAFLAAVGPAGLITVALSDMGLNLSGAWLDGEEIVDGDIAGAKVGVRIEVSPSKPCGIATYMTKGAYKNIRYRELTADEVKGAKADAGADKGVDPSKPAKK
jgi:ABC-type sugar transport system permease subunit